jgi:hypothetical protein
VLEIVLRPGLVYPKRFIAGALGSDRHAVDADRGGLTEGGAAPAARGLLRDAVEASSVKRPLSRLHSKGRVQDNDLSK